MEKTEYLVEVVVLLPQGKRKLYRHVVWAGTNADAYRIVEDRYNGRNIYDAYVTANADKIAKARAWAMAEPTKALN
jgi:hypothetical protein